MAANEKRSIVHIPTLTAISLVAWALVDVLHEIVGHAGASILIGLPVKAVSTTTAYIDFNWDQLVAERGLSPIRVMVAAGTVINLITGALALLALQWKKVTGTGTRYFLWLFATFSLVIVTMNLVTNPLLGFGDWTDFLSGLEPKSIWKTVVVGTGLMLMVAGYVLTLRLWMPRLKGQRFTLIKVTVLPVITMIVVQTMSLVKSPFAALPPERNHLLASVFAYIHLVLWAVVVNLVPEPRSSDSVDAIRLPGSNTWLALGLVVLVLYVIVLGPGIGSFAGDPRLG